MARRDPLELDYRLPPERIAQKPLAERDAARMLVLERSHGRCQHARVRDLPHWLEPGDLLVVNATRVEPARLRGRKLTGGTAEALLLESVLEAPGRWRALVRTRGRLRPGLVLRFERGDATLEATLVEVDAEGVAELAFPPDAEPHRLGEMPLPPYIRRPAPEAWDAERYQTVFAREPGSVAAPTAGLHLTQRLFDALARRGVECAEVVLHVGPGTFRPLACRDFAQGALHPERFQLPEATADAVARARERGGRVLAVGTTTTRVLESCATRDGRVRAASGETRLFLRPGARFRVVDRLLTNFHLPRSSLLYLVAAFAGREMVLAAYEEAVAAGYRFYSYGDAMLIR